MTPNVSGGWSIRLVADAELAQVVLLERETKTAPHWAWADYGPLLRSNPTDVLRRCLYVAVDGRVVLGFAVGKALGLRPEVDAELESVVVRPEQRRQGLGSALCRKVMEWSRLEGASAIGLEVRAGSSGAIRLYGGMGFVAVGRRPGYYHEPDQDAVVMRCVLSKAGMVTEARQERDGQPVLF